MKVIVYGDFNCPYSALASHRVDALLGDGQQVEWRAVQHDPEMPPAGVPVEDDLKKEIEREIDEILDLVEPGEDFVLNLPRERSNTLAASEMYSTLGDDEADDFRRRAFMAQWVEGRNISSADAVVALAPSAGPHRRRAARWQEEWMGFDQRVVPLLVLPDGEIVRGVEALKRLADLVDG